MARSRRRAPAKRRKRADWVYRSREYLIDGTAGTLNGGWMSVATTITPGAAPAQSFCLFDSVNYMRTVLAPNNALGDGGAISQAGRPEARGDVVLAIQGTVFIRPSAWAVGNVMSGAYRLIITDQDEQDGYAITDADYNAMVPPAAQSPANDGTLWANERSHLMTKYVYRGFSDNSSVIAINMFWRGRRRLRPEEGVFLYVEVNGPDTTSSSVNHIVTPKLRCLVERAD